MRDEFKNLPYLKDSQEEVKSPPFNNLVIFTNVLKQNLMNPIVLGGDNTHNRIINW